MQNLKEKYLCFQKCHEEFSKYSLEHVQKSKNRKKCRKFMSLKFTGEFCIVTTSNDTKFEDQLTCQFQIMRNLTSFDLGTRKF